MSRVERQKEGRVVRIDEHCELVQKAKIETCIESDLCYKFYVSTEWKGNAAFYPG